MTATALTPFDVCGALPSGTTVLEASAGTGKTYTIAALAARYVAEGIPLEQILLVTFTRMATGELRERVRQRLVEAERALTETLRGVAPHHRDEVAALLCSGDRDELSLRRERLARAVTTFDAATIATTHSFCQDVLSELGILADVEPEYTFTELIDDLREEVVDDLYVRAFREATGQPHLTRKEAGEIAALAAAHPQAPIVPRRCAPGSIALRRVKLAYAVRKELDRRKRRLAVMGYDDLLQRLLLTLKGENGAAAVRRLQEHYRVVLIDEFQDTDPDQWDIVERAFAGSETALVLIADPKQAIYAFRGADVYAYLAAKNAADRQHTLDVNRRSDSGLLDGYDALFHGAELGHRGIAYRPVEAAPGHQGTRLKGDVGKPLQLRIMRRDSRGITQTKGGQATADSARETIARDVAAQVVRLLRAGAKRELRDEGGNVLDLRPIGPGDVAVLVRKHRNASAIHEALRNVGVPSVMGGAGSVFATTAAEEWLWLLEALEQPASSSRARKVAISCFIGHDAAWLAGAGEPELEEVHLRLHRWARVLREAGVAALLTAVNRSERLPARILRQVDGERRMTDLRHVAQLLHQAARSEGLGVAALAGWLGHRIATAEEQNSDEERSRRLESDDQAVQVMTIHRSKGLEFPVVLCPDLWDVPWTPDGKRPIAFHDADAEDELTLEVGLDDSLGYLQHLAKSEQEEEGESLRVAYVALTRAMHQCQVWWVGTRDSFRSPLSRLLFNRDEHGAIIQTGRKTPQDDYAESVMRELAARAPDSISVAGCEDPGVGTWEGVPRERLELAAASFTRTLDMQWRRASYSSITAAAYEPHVASEPEQPALDDEPPVPVGAPEAGEPVPDGALAAPSPMAELPVGTAFGTVVHRVLEQVDFAAEDLPGEVAAALAEPWARLLGPEERAICARALVSALETPLGSALGDVPLRGVSRGDRLDELVFELPLVGGDVPTAQLQMGAVADLLDETLAEDDPLRGYGARLRDPALTTTLRGYLNGSIDLLLRTRQRGGEGAEERFSVIDYKTNWLGAEGDELVLAHYRPAALAEEMLRAHYALQALIYSAAAYRFLRWRVPGFDFDRRFAGVFYLFLRGMSGASTPAADGGRCGVFYWKPPAGLVPALSDLLDQGRA